LHLFLYMDIYIISESSPQIKDLVNQVKSQGQKGNVTHKKRIQFRYHRTVDKSKCFTFLIKNSHRPRAKTHPGAIMCDIIAGRTSRSFLHPRKSLAVWVNTENKSGAICSRTLRRKRQFRLLVDILVLGVNIDTNSFE